MTAASFLALELALPVGRRCGTSVRALALLGWSERKVRLGMQTLAQRTGHRRARPGCVNPGVLRLATRVDLRRGNGTILSEQDVIEIRRLRGRHQQLPTRSLHGCIAQYRQHLRGKSWRDMT